MKAIKWLKQKSFGGGKGDHADEQAPLPEEVILVAVLEVNLHDPHCPGIIRKGCMKTRGVESAEVDVVNRRATVKGRFGVEELKKRLKKVHKVVKVVELVKEEAPQQQEEEDETPNEAETGTQDETPRD